MLSFNININNKYKKLVVVVVVETVEFLLENYHILKL